MSNIIVIGNRNKNANTSASIDAVSKIMKGEKGDPGSDGAPGRDGTDASVTAQNIQNALGYVPAKSGDLSSVEARVTELEENPVFPDDDDILVMSAETGLIDPLTDSDGKFFVEGDGILYVL